MFLFLAVLTKKQVTDGLESKDAGLLNDPFAVILSFFFFFNQGLKESDVIWEERKLQPHGKLCFRGKIMQHLTDLRICPHSDVAVM